MKNAMRLLIGLGIIVNMMNGCNRESYDVNEKVYTEEDMIHFYSEKTPIEELSEIDIQSAYANIEVVASDGYYVEYSYYYIDNEPELTIEGNHLIFSDESMNRGSYSLKVKEDNYLKIYIPTSNEFTNVDIDKSSGDCSVSGLYADELNIHNQYGDTYISNCQINNLTINQSSGKLCMENDDLVYGEIENIYGEVEITGICETVFPVKNLNIVMSSGTMNINKLNADILEFKNNYGDCSILNSRITKLKGRMSSGNADFGSSSMVSIKLTNPYGNIKIALSGVSDDYQFDVNSTYGKIYIGTNVYVESLVSSYGGKKKVELDTSSGDIKIDFYE